MPGGSWDGNHQLKFAAAGEKQYFVLSMKNDRWEETNFKSTGVTFDNTGVWFDQSLSPRDFVVGLEGYGYNWYANEQTGDMYGRASAADEIRGCAVRVLVRGEEMHSGSWIKNDGGNCLFLFRSAYDVGHMSRKLRIEGAYIAECADSTVPTMDAKPGTSAELRFYDYDIGAWTTKITIENGSAVWAYYPSSAPYPVEREKSYLVSFLVGADADEGNPFVWSEKIDPSVPSSYILPASTNRTLADLTTPVWSTIPGAAASSNLYAVQYMYSMLPTSGVFVSQVYDTNNDSPAYSRMDWAADVPAGCTLRMKVRTGSDPEMSDAPAWSNVTAMASSGGINPGSKRYVQFLARMTPNSVWWGSATPRLKNVTVAWAGHDSIVDIGGTFTKGPDCGIFEVFVDGRPLKTGVRVDLEIFQDTRGFVGNRRVTSALSAMVTPRNSGR
jgi:hypothetical protein